MKTASVTKTMDSPNDPPIKSHDDLLSVFALAHKPREAWRIGPEFEKFGIYEDSLAPIPYEGKRGVLRIFESLVEGHGWAPEHEYDGGPIIALTRGGGSITLEPGGQLELSGAAVSDVHKVCGEFRGHLTEITSVSKELGIRWLGLGFHPFARRDEFSWVPKSRYPIMREYLPTRGSHAIDMMLRTSTVQANYDFENERDAMRKMRAALALSPVTTAMFANSPWLEGKPHGGVTYRARVWLDVDPDRSGLLPKLWAKGARYDDYVEWALDVPMFMFKREGRAVINTGQTFRSFWKSGFEGHHALMSDWKTHLNTLFPEVRLKNTIEIRGADAQMTPMRCALPALWTGIFYDARALDEAEALTADWSYEEVAALRPELWRLGLRSPFRGATLVKIAERVMEIAEGGLERRAVKSPSGKDERVHLARLKALITHGHSPADDLLAETAGVPDLRRAIVEKSALL
jgi:glutamate--cysteine ligase